MTKITGVLFILLAVALLVITISNFTVQFAAAGPVAEKQGDYGLTTTTTDLRLAMGIELLVQILVVGVLALIGWFLYASETEQYAYVIVVGVIFLVMVLVRVTPLLSWSTIRISPGTLFYGCQSRLALVSDATQWYATMPTSDQFRVGTVNASAPQGKGVILLDFHNDQELLTKYTQSPKPVEVVVSISGTGTIAWKRDVFMIPKAKVWKVGAQ
jgi:hypothetical protein